MSHIAIMGNGPVELIPDLSDCEPDVWIGADRGALVLLEKGITPDYAVGDFDSMSFDEQAKVERGADVFEKYPVEKEETDLDIALNKAYDLHAETISLFGVTGGRLDHALINMQLLYPMKSRNVSGAIIDQQNQLELAMPGEHEIRYDMDYPTISFIPFTQQVKGLTLHGFYYGLADKTLLWGSTRCISNRLISNSGTFSFDEGILLIIKSCDG
ncbi:thiamine diphosphokinase [Barrientosiimonas marina]|uniref:Thiamine diphosphokinase n=1 Tax=Lentibacillus kimchii TaxID=1542911 RepID=A0ABW2UUI3_9BACI